MPALPVPLIAAFVLGAFLLHARLTRRGGEPLHWLVALCAAQSVLIALHQHYGVTLLRPVQPVTASLVPPAAFLAFRLTAVGPLSTRHLGHFAPPLLVLGAVLLFPVAIDALVMTIFALYGIALLLALRGGADALVRTRLAVGDRPLLVWRLVAAVLLLSAVSDGLIVLDHAVADGVRQPWIVTVSSSLTLLAMGWLALSPSLEAPSGPPVPMEDEAARSEPSEADRELMARLEALMGQEPVYLDQNLTLARLARRLAVPAKTLSAAINRTTGENVSRYVNARRIERACALLAAGDDVTGAMLESGFNTKSNFNREFRRLKGMAPTDWVATLKR